MKEICEKGLCCGCEACLNICPRNAIVMIDKDGFYYPVINDDLCCNCGECIRVCPELTQVPRYAAQDFVFAAVNKDKQIRDGSSSGGVFYSLAIEMLKIGGVVYGAELWHDMVVRHVRINKKSEIHRVQKSKYLQSSINGTYRQAQQDLINGGYVLYSGLPCQIAGLRSYLGLGSDFSRLITCELLCHGAASPIVFQSHIEYIADKLESSICDINFRYKTPQRPQCIAYTMENGKTAVVTDPMKDYFYYGFQSGILLRDSCYQCGYVGRRRCADITLGDFWGLNEGAIDKPDELAYPSLVFANTDKGRKMLDKIADNFIHVKRRMDEAAAGNLCLRRPIPKHRFHRSFFLSYAQNGYRVAASSYLIETYGWKEITKRILGRRITSWLIKVLHR